MPRPAAALAHAAVCHVLFVVAVAAMAVNLHGGMRLGLGPRGGLAVPWDLMLVAQFGLGHSFLLTRRGARVLRALAPAGVDSTLDTTVFATLASLQVLLVFGFWAPLPVAPVPLTGAAAGAATAVALLAWLTLGAAMAEAGLGVQLGTVGWWALLRGRPPRYPEGFPRTGLHAWCRHPIYLAFAVALWAGPIHSLDRVLLGLPLTAYCLLAPRRKERRMLARHGAEYAAYRAATPAFLPRRPAPSTAPCPRPPAGRPGGRCS